ncbi:LuxR C-terminal-related transcriptional regulator [Streptomyces sp. NPDC017943]|uniref:LuxR C-terminal-related transcriptional regulator n=1 Tax=Streptomyces sp. NPDC017943 TaxID=3365019 RepID=UPI0037BCF30F
MGRRGESGVLDELLAGAGRAEGAVALVSGSPGCGKSALLAEFAARAADAGALVLSAGGSPAEAGLPLGVVGRLLGGTGTGTGTGTGAPAGGRPQVLYEALSGVRSGRPVVVVVDDAHHLDEESGRALLYVCARLTGTDVLVVLAGQPPEPSSPTLTELWGQPRVVRVPLQPLTEHEVADLLREPAGGGMDAGTAGRLAPHWHGFTGGNPRLLRGLLDDLRECGPLRSVRPVAGTAFRAAVAACLQGAGTAVTATAGALAVLGEDATLTRLARLLAVPELTVSRRMEQLEAVGLLDGGRLRHRAVPAAVLRHLGAGDRGRLHARAARMLYDDGAEPSRIAVHLAEAGDAAADEGGAHGPGLPLWAPAVLTEAARCALRAGAAHQAVRFLQVAHRARGGGALAGGMLTAVAGAEWESDPALVTRHLPSLEGEVRGVPGGDRGAVPPDAPAGCVPADVAHRAEAAGLLLWHGRRVRREQRAPATGEREWGRGTGARQVQDASGFVWPVAGEPVVEPDADDVEAVLDALVRGYVPAPAVPELLVALVYAGETRRAAQWCALTRGVEKMRGTAARRAVALAVAAVVHVRTGAHDRGADYARQALGLLSPAAWGVAAGMPLSAGVCAATALGAHEEAERLLRVPAPEAMFDSRVGVHYLLARGRHRLEVGRARAAQADFRACRDLTARWGPLVGEVADWRGPAAQALRVLGEASDPAAESGAPGGSPLGMLTRSERRVAVLAAGGCTNRAIAARLHVTPSTVEQHLTNVYRKVRVKSRAGLAELVGGRVPTAVGGGS